MQQRFLELRTTPYIKSEVLADQYDQKLTAVRSSLGPLVDAVRPSWHEIRSGWSSNHNVAEYYVYLSPPIEDSTGSFDGDICVGVNIEDPEDYLVSYTIYRKIKGGFETAESKGYRITPTGQYMADFLNNPHIAIPIRKDKEGIKQLQFVEELIKNAVELAHASAETTK